MTRLFLALASLCSLSLLAAEPATLIVSPQQREALGIELAAVTPADSYPTSPVAAQVVAARDAQWQVTTPLAGQIVRVLPVGSPLRAGEPVAVVASAPLMQLGADYVEAQNQAEQAIAARKRAEALYEDGLVALKHREQAERDERQAIAQREALRNQLRLLGIQPEEALRGELPIAAPFAGRVSAVHVTTGSSVDAAMPVVEIINPQALELVVHWPLSRGEVPAVGARFANADGVLAHVLAQAPSSADGRQTVQLRLGLAAAAPQLRPGQWIWLNPQQQASVLGVNRNAVIRNAGQAVVFSETADGFAVIPVVVAGENGDMRFVSGEVPADARLAISGLVALKGMWLGHGGE